MRRCATKTARPKAKPTSSAGPAASPAEVATAATSEAEAAAPADGEPDWEGDGTVDLAPDDSEWGGDAPARANNLGDDETHRCHRARAQPGIAAVVPAPPGAVAAPVDENDRAALRFLIESLNDDGYLEDSLPALASGLAGDDNDQFDELVHHFQVALGLLQSLEPAGVGARSLGECLTHPAARAGERQARARTRPRCARPRIAICKQPMELLARRDFKRLATLTRSNEERSARCAAADRPARAQAGPPLRRRRAQHRRARRASSRASASARNAKFRVHAQSRSDAAPARARHLRRRAQAAQGRGQPGAVAAAAGGALVHQEHPAALRHHPARVQRDRRAAEELLRARRARDAAAGAARDRRRAGPARVHHQPRDHRQVHGHALRHRRAQVLLRLRARHRNRRQRLQHRGARADQAVRRAPRT